MRRLAVPILIIVCAAVAARANSLANPGFETGDLTGWGRSSNVTVSAGDAHAGSYGAKLPAGNAWVSQNLYSVLRPNTTYTLAAWMRINSIAADSATWGNAYIRAGEFQDLGTEVLPGNGFAPSRSPSMIGQWQYVQGTWTSPADLTSLPGTGVFYVGVREFGINADVSIDDLAFIGPPIPEPLTITGVLLGVGGLARYARRRAAA